MESHQHLNHLFIYEVQYMIFIAGVHGVGKTFLCNRIKREIEISIYSASELLKEDKEINYIRYEKTDDFMENQKRLLEIVKKKNGASEYILEGHFCLMNDRGRIENIPVSMFRQFLMKGILLLIGNPKKSSIESELEKPKVKI